MIHIKKFIQFIKENQTQIQFKDIDPFTFNITEFIELCKDHGLEYTDNKMGSVERDEENEFDNINIDNNIFPFEKYEIGYKLYFKRSSSFEFDEDTLNLLVNYLQLEHDDWEIVSVSTEDNFILNILSNIVITLKIEDWLKFYRDWEIIENKIIVKCPNQSIIDCVKFRSDWGENVIRGYDNTNHYFGYDSEKIEDALYPFDNDNIDLLCDILGNKELSSRREKESFISNNMELITDDLKDQITQEYTDYVVNMNEHEAYEKTIDEFEELMRKEFKLTIHKRQFDPKTDELVYWYEFNIDWIKELKKEEADISIHTTLNHIFDMWYECIYGYKPDFEMPDIIYSTWLDEEQKKEYNSTIKSILLDHLNKSV